MLCVFSSERQSNEGKLLCVAGTINAHHCSPLAEGEFEKGNVGELATLEAFRVRILPVLGPIPSVVRANALRYR